MANGTNVGNAYLQIIPSAKGMQGALTKQMNNEAGNTGDETGKTLADRIKSALKKAAIGATLATTLKSALTEGAALEQSIGGVEAIFGESADKVQQYAKDSWKSVGISANAYMENVTSFSAALINSMGGDTDKAAEVANQALIDMGDNANRFGTDMASIQTAYQGFAKQNYTMLDNLKLGYGGTKTEMERLLKDAQEISGVEYDISNLGDVYSAIHVIQEELNVAGTTAKEAATTLTGSSMAMKAAWQDLLGNMAIGEDVAAPLQNLSVSISNYLGNLIPMVGNIISQLPGAIATMIGTLVPQLLQTGTDIIRNISSGITQGIPEMVTSGSNALISFIGTLRTHLGEFISAGLELVQNLLQGIVNAIPTLMAKIPETITGLVGIITDNVPKLVPAGKNILTTLWQGIKAVFKGLKDNWRKIFDALKKLVTDIDWIGLGKDVLQFIRDGFIALKDTLPKKIKEIATTAWEWFKNVDWLGLGKKVITFIVNGLAALVSNIPSKLKEIGTTAFNWFRDIDWLGLGKKIISFIVSGLGAIASGVLSIPGKLLDIGKNALEGVKKIDWLGLGKSIISGIVGGLGAVVSGALSIPGKLLDIGKSAIKGVKDLDWGGTGKAMTDGIAGGVGSGKTNPIKSALEKLVEAAKSGAESKSGTKYIGEAMANGVIAGLDSKIDKVREKAEKLAWEAQKGMVNVSRISSPSRLFRDTVGKYIALGVAVGIEQYTPAVERAAEDLINSTLNTGVGLPELALRTASGTLETAINSGNSEPTYNIVVNAEMDGTQLKTTVKDYVVDTVSAEQRAELKAMGAR